VAYHLGVDVGTTFTAAAISRDRRAEVVSLGTRRLEIPSLAFLDEDGNLLLGEAADRRMAAGGDPNRLAREFKRRLGDPTPILLGGAPFSADSLMVSMLRAVVEIVGVREGGPADSVAVTRPANWGEYKRDLLDQAIRQAEVASVITVVEPQAAAVHYASTTRVFAGDVVGVYDLGGGTFDAAVLRKTPSGFEPLGQPDGIERLGGIDFDEAVFNHVTGSVGDALSNVDLDDPGVVAALARLRRDCTDAKEALSSDTDAVVSVVLPSGRVEVRLTRAEFERMIRPSLTSTMQTLRRVMQSADIDPQDVSAIVLVGGSSRIPLVAQMATETFGRPVAVDLHPKHAIALGAAQLAATGAAPLAPPRARSQAPTGAPTAPVRPTLAPRLPPAPVVRSPTPEPAAAAGLSAPLQPAVRAPKAAARPVPVARADSGPDDARLDTDVTEQQRRHLALLAALLGVFLVVLIVILAVVR
jgi:molecular chaperone DnaK